MTLLAFGADPDSWNIDEGGDGNPGIGLVGLAIQVWAWLQDRPVTVNEAALTFNMAAELVRQAVADHPWMFLNGDRIEHEGE